MSKGKVVLIPFPFTDLSSVKVRPAVVLHASTKGDDCIVAFMSSKKQRKVYEWDVSVKANEENGLKADSILKVDKIATLQKKIVIGEIGEISARDMKKVDTKLRTLFCL